MNLSLLGRVLWRQKAIVFLGVIVAVAASVFSAYRLTDGKLESRTISKYESHARLLVTGLSPYQTAFVKGTNQGDQIVKGLEAAQLAGTYPYVIVSDDFLNRVDQRLNIPRDSYKLTAYRRTTAPDTDQNATIAVDNNLPVIEIAVTGNTAQQAAAITNGAAQTFIDYVGEQENGANIPADQRVTVGVLSAASKPTMVGKSPLLLEGIVAFAVLVAFVALAFARYNARMGRRGRVDIRDTTSQQPPVSSPPPALEPVELRYGERTRSTPEERRRTAWPIRRASH